MDWISFTDDQNQNWLVHQDGLWLLCQQYVYAQMMYERAHVVPEITPWYSIGPNISNVEIDFKNFHEIKVRDAENLYDQLTHASLSNADNVFGQLVQMKCELDLYTQKVSKMKRDVAHGNSASIESHANFFGDAAAVAKIVRDTSISILVAGSAFVSGGASLAVLGTGSALQGTATYEDTGKIGGAVLSATGTFFVGALPIVGGGVTNSVYLRFQASRDIKWILWVMGAMPNAAAGFGTEMQATHNLGKSLVYGAARAGLSVATPFMHGRLVTSTLPVVVDVAIQAASRLGQRKLAAAAANAMPSIATRPVASAKLQHLIGVATQLDKPVSPDDYVSQTALCRTQ